MMHNPDWIMAALGVALILAVALLAALDARYGKG